MSASAAMCITAAAYALFVVVYFWSFGSSAWHPTDYEHIIGFTWHVIHGEVPYRDFIYHKPPGTIFLHAVWQLFPDGWQVRASRLFFYVQMAAVGFLPIGWALRRERIAFGWRLPFLGVACLMLALHNFPPITWQTTDSVLFATIGMVALVESTATRDRRRILTARAVASASLALALLCKQGFLAPCLLLALLAVGELLWKLRRSRRSPGSVDLRAAVGLFVASGTPAIALVAILFVYLVATGALNDAIAQFQSQSTARPLKYSAFYSLMARSRYWWVGFLWATLPLLRLVGSAGGRVWHWAARIAALPFLWYLARLAHEHAAEGLDALGFILFFMLVGALLGRIMLALVALALPATRRAALRVDPQMLLLHFGFVLIAWSCQLSLGYRTPILGVAGLGLVFHELLPPERSPLADVVPVVVACSLAGFAMWKVNYERPYRDLTRASLTYDLGEIFPKLSGIRTNPQMFGRYLELKRLVTTYALQQGRQFAVTQDWPGVHWLFNDENPISCDWCWNRDIVGFEPRLLAELERKAPVVIVPKENKAPWKIATRQLPPCSKVSFMGHNLVSQTVAAKWTLIGDSPNFCVFAPPESR